MKNKNKTRLFYLPQPKWKWLLAWLIIHPIAATPAVMMVLKIGPFAPPFVANGPVFLPAFIVAVLPSLLFFHGSGMFEPVKERD